MTCACPIGAVQLTKWSSVLLRELLRELLICCSAKSHSQNTGLRLLVPVTLCISSLPTYWQLITSSVRMLSVLTSVILCCREVSCMHAGMHIRMLCKVGSMPSGCWCTQTSLHLSWSLLTPLALFRCFSCHETLCYAHAFTTISSIAFVLWPNDSLLLVLMFFRIAMSSMCRL